MAGVMGSNPFLPQRLVGRSVEFQQICAILAADHDLLLAGVPGSGRRTLLGWAAQAVGVKMLTIDCLRATDCDRFLHLLAEAILTTFPQAAELELIEAWQGTQPIILERAHRPRLFWHSSSAETWAIFQSLLSLPQFLAEVLQCRVVIAFQNFPHLRSWDRGDRWQQHLCQEIHRQTHVSYALIATVAERLVEHSNLQVVFLGPLPTAEIQLWVNQALAAKGYQFDPAALGVFLNYVQGHLGDAIALLRRIWLDTQQVSTAAVPMTIAPHQVHRSLLALVEDLSFTFESLILLLPPSQVRVLESLALDPTDRPHARDYIRKHGLSRGGSLQGALASLEQKGLVYGADCQYQLTSPLLACWLQQRLG